MTTEKPDRRPVSKRSQIVCWLIVAICSVVGLMLYFTGTDRAFQTPYAIFSGFGLIVSVFFWSGWLASPTDSALASTFPSLDRLLVKS